MGTFGGAGPSALSDLIGLAFANSVDGTLPGQKNNDQPTIETLLKSRMQDSAGWKSATDIGFAGLPAGIPLFVGMLAKLAEQITGIDITVWLDQWNDNPAVSTLEGMVQDILGSIFAVSANLQSIFANLNFLDPDFDPQEALEAWIQLVLLPTNMLASWAEMFQQLTGLGGGGLGDLAGLLSGGLFGPITPGRISILPTGLIGDASPNVLEDPDLLSPDFNGSGVFFKDTTKTYDGSNSARVVGDGSGSKEMLSKTKHQVDKNQTFYLSCRAAWTLATGTGTPIHLGITEYNGTSTVAQKDVVLRAVSPTTTDFVQLAGNYTVPATGVTHIKLRWGIGPTATAGTYYFAKFEMRPTRKIPIDLSDGLQDELDSLLGGLDAALDELLDKVGIGDFLNLKDVLSGGLGGAIGDIQARLNAFLHGGSTLNGSNIGFGDIADQFVGGVKSIFNSIFFGGRNVSQQGGAEASRADTYDTMLSLADGVTSIAARVATLETVYTSGISTGDDFERTSSTSLGPKWLVYYKGSGSHVVATANGHDAAVVTNGLGDREFLAIFNSASSDDHIRSSTPNQRVLVPLASSAGSFFGSLAANDVWLRISDDTTGWANVTGIQIRFTGDGDVQIIRWVAGNPTILNETSSSTQVPIPGPGHIIGGEAGTPGVGRYFKAILGSNGVLDIPEVGTASGYGAAFQRWGLGGKIDGHLLPLPGVQKPGGARQWTAMDQ